jgi:hypothetical protein
VVLPVGNVDVAVLVERNAPRLVELAVAATGLTALGDNFAFRREDLQAIVAAVDDDHVAVGFADDAGRAAQLAGSVAGRAPFADELALSVEDRDSARPLVGDVDVALFVDRDAEWPDGFAVLRAVGGELGEQLLLARAADFDVIDPHPEVVLVGAIGDVDVTVVPQAHRLRVVEARAIGRSAADGVAPIVRASFDICGERHCRLP